MRELELDPGVDTLGKWMAHYVAENIVLAESLSEKKRKRAEKECSEIIMALWEHRWSLPREKPFLADFEPLFETLDKLDPRKNTSLFLPLEFYFDLEQDINESLADGTDLVKEDTDGDIYDSRTLLNITLKVDKLARSLIADCLNQAIVSLDLSEERREIIDTSISAIDYPESRIIRIIADYDKSAKSLGGEVDETHERIRKVNEKIGELEELRSITESLLNRYRKELLDLKK